MTQSKDLELTLCSVCVIDSQQSSSKRAWVSLGSASDTESSFSEPTPCPRNACQRIQGQSTISRYRFYD